MCQYGIIFLLTNFPCLDMQYLFINLSVSEHLYCFYYLTIRINFLCTQFLCAHVFSFLLNIYLGVELLDHMGTLYLSFEELPDCFPKQLHHFTFLPAVYMGEKQFLKGEGDDETTYT